MSGPIQPTMGQLMTPQMREEIEDQKGSPIEQMRLAQHQALQRKSIRMSQERLKKTIKKRDANRKKNKAARKARRKQR